MVFENHPRRFSALLSAVVVVSTLSCFGQKRENEKTRHGDDVLASGSTPTVYDSVPGDAILMGGKVSFSGSTGGDYLGLGGQQAITGRIHGSLRAAAGEVHVAASIDRNATIAGGNVEMDSVGVIGGNAYLWGGSVQLNGTVRQGLVVAAGKVTLNGVVGGDVQVEGGSLTVGPRAQIAGNLRYSVPKSEVHIDSAARISGTVTALPTPRGGGAGHLLWTFGFLLAGAVAVALLPGFAAAAAEIIPRRPARAALLGLGWACLVPFAVLLMAITIIGLPLAFLAAALYLIVVSLSSVPFSIWLGRRLLGARARPGDLGTLLNFFVGALLLLLVGLIPLLGVLLQVIAAIIGLGAIMIAVHALREKQPAQA
jgi:cytoskeletal protein CcmA (bactofilin family)